MLPLACQATTAFPSRPTATPGGMGPDVLTGSEDASHPPIATGLPQPVSGENRFAQIRPGQLVLSKGHPGTTSFIQTANACPRAFMAMDGDEELPPKLVSSGIGLVQS